MALIERAKNIIMRPKQEWPVIDAEQTTVGALYTGYIIPLSAIPPIASLIGWSVFGVSLPFVGTIRIPIGTALGRCAVQYVLGLIGVYIVALIIDALAPSFNGTKNQVQALKVAAYSYTAAWVGGIFMLLPALSIITLLFSLYGLYLLYTGLPVLMKSPAEKALGYTVVVIIAVIVLTIIIGVIVGSLFSFGTGLGRAGM